MDISSLSPAELAAKYVNNTNKHIFLTGKAGTGKTTFLREIINKTYKNAVVAAPTGIAAINAGGVTLHSLFQLPFGAFTPQNTSFNEESQLAVNTPKSLISRLKINSHKRKLINEIELLIIDEVSMLRSDLLDAIDTVLRYVRRNKNIAFGGIQILFIGDMLQLPPVVKKQEWELLSQFYNSQYFFDANVLRDDMPIYVELEKVYRQSDQQFIELLNRLRQNIISEEDRRLLNRHFDESFQPDPDEGYIYITTHNIKANKKNQYELDRLPADAYFYSAYISGDFEEHNYPHLETLELKEGAQVMFIKNDPTGQQRFFNGKIGTVSYLDKETIHVRCNDGEEVEVERYEWENKRYSLNKRTQEIEEKIKGTFAQYPLRLAWAITVHKSQGLTFDQAILDLSHSFSPGQVYVALSRLTSLKGLVLTTPLPDEALENDPNLTAYISSKPDTNTLRNLFHLHSDEYYLQMIQSAFTFDKVETELFFLMKSYRSKEKRTLRQPYEPWGMGINKEVIELRQIGIKFHRQAGKILTQESSKKYQLLRERLIKARDYFLPALEQLSNKIDLHYSEIKSNKKLKSYGEDLKKLSESIFSHKKMIVKAEMVIRSVSEGRDLTKQEVLRSDIYKSSKKAGSQKTPTRDISFEMYKKGLDIEEIAEKRGLVSGTIAGHLSFFVKSGQLDILDFVSEEKVNNILTVIEKFPEKQLSDIKNHLGEEYTYGDIKFVLAHRSKEA